MPWFHVQLLRAMRFNFLCDNYNFRLSNVMENIHKAKMLQPRTSSIVLESIQLLHRKLQSALHAVNCTLNHGINSHAEYLLHWLKTTH